MPGNAEEARQLIRWIQVSTGPGSLKSGKRQPALKVSPSGPRDGVHNGRDTAAGTCGVIQR